MPSQSEIKLFSSLKLKKFRQKYGLFVVEGLKTVTELLHSSLDVRQILADRDFDVPAGNIPVNLISKQEMARLSSMDTPPGILAIAAIPVYDSDPILSKGTGPVLALDGIRDPGNLGTIIRIADWYGVGDLLLSEDCTDVYNPKCIQASMGSFLRVRCRYGNLQELLPATGLPVLGCTLQGRNIRETLLPERCILLIGSESHGISGELLPLLDQEISIPRFGGAESLNAGIATAIVLDRCVR
jgi:TrmH family RNA methyltransferase